MRTALAQIVGLTPREVIQVSPALGRWGPILARKAQAQKYLTLNPTTGRYELEEGSSSDGPSLECPICGFLMEAAKCKETCSNCGTFWDCSDI